MARAEDEKLIGRTIAGKFTIEATIGSGAMGQVFRARQLALDKIVALKVLHHDLAGDEMFAGRFQREALAASRLDHPNSMRVIDFGAEPDGMLYIAMEFLDGRDLHRVLYEEGPLPERRAVDILQQALSALIVAHDMGVIHRDLKPENIMILPAVDDEGNPADLVKVCDFGIAKISNAKTLAGVTSARGPLTTQGLVVGTPEYMSPEQGRGDPLDARSDLYSVGVILFQLLTGRLPFQAETALGLVFKQVNETPPRPSTLRPDVDPRLEAICLRALAKAPDDRFQTARELRGALRSYFGSDGVRFASGPLTGPRLTPPGFDRADTVSLRSSPSAGFGAATTSQVLPLRTETGSAALPPLPVSKPNVWVMGALAIVVGAAITGVGLTRFAPPTGKSVASDPEDTASGAATADGASTTKGAAASAAKATVAAASASAPAALPSAAVGQAAHASRVATPPAQPKPADAPPVAVNLTTAAASPTVTRANGASARDVRAALPSWVFTQCYRTGLQKAGKALDGHVVLTLSIDGTGAVSKVAARGPLPLLSATGDCMVEAVRSISVNNTPPAGGSAEVDIECTPH